MKTCLLIVTLSMLAGSALAQQRVDTLLTRQPLTRPGGGTNFPNATDVAIDGSWLIVMDGAALLYRRDAQGRWAYSRTLIEDPGSGGARDVVMKGSLAIIKVGATSTIWQLRGNSWHQEMTAAPITAPGGFAISNNRILVGADGCSEDALVYEKNATTNLWGVTGRVPADDGTCANVARVVELNYNYALIRGSGDVLRSYRRGSGATWANAGNIALTGAAAQFRAPPALQLDTLVLNDLSYYRRASTGWSRVGKVVPLNHPNGAGDQGDVLYRDSVLLVNDEVDGFQTGSTPYVYVKNAQGGFDHVAVLGSTFAAPVTFDFDISVRDVVALTQSGRGSIFNEIVVYKLPLNLVKPRAVANNFEARDISAFSTSPGSQYALAGNAYNQVYRQSNLTADTAAIHEQTHWPDYQSVTVDLKPNAFTRPDSWIGLAVRYVDANNHYFVSLGNDDVIRLQRKLNGVVTTLAQASRPVTIGAWQNVTLVTNGSRLDVYLDGDGVATATDSALSWGKAALLTAAARADFDNFYAAPTTGLAVLSEEPPYLQSRRDYTLYGGNWESNEFPTGPAGFRQSDTSGQALAIQGLPMDDQSIRVDVTLDTFASTNPVAWYGVVTRFVDPDNFYYLSVRSSGQLQIRKMVNGSVSVLRAMTMNVTPGDSYRLEFSAIGNELTAYVDGIPLARAVDDDLPRGRFGLGTYRAGATYTLINARQP